jgi:AraC-like DNA-binding protein
VVGGTALAFPLWGVFCPPPPKPPQPVMVSSTLTVLYMVATLLTGVGFFLVMPAEMQAGILLLGLTAITYLLFENRYPQFYRLVAQEERQEKYRRSLIQGLSTGKIMARLQELMEEERIYRELELRLDDVAARLLITPHQLSEFVNDQLGVSFPVYVNKYRVDEAKELLLADPDRSTLSIGFEAGFGSKQAFNTSFKQQTGMTPTEFRRSNLSTEKS